MWELAHTRKKKFLEEKQVPSTRGGISKRERLIKIRLKANLIWSLEDCSGLVAWKADLQ